MQGNIDRVIARHRRISRIHFRGGSHIGISRASPVEPAAPENVVISLLRLNVSSLITIGGDDTMFSA
jgi:6-phosphofructokinase 1